MGSWTIPLRLPDVWTQGLSAKGFAVVLHRTRFTILGVSVGPRVEGMTALSIHDRGVHVTAAPSQGPQVTAALPPMQRDYRLVIHAVGQPLVVRDKYLVVTGIDTERSVDGWTLVPEGVAPARIEEVADPLIEIDQRRAKLVDDPSPLRPHRLFFLRMDQWTDVRTFGSPPVLPAPVAPPVGADVVLEALRVETLSDGLGSWVRCLEDTGTELDLTYGGTYSPQQWIQSMATYLMDVFEYAFQEAFGRPLVTAAAKGKAKAKPILDPEFAVAFEEFANGKLGEWDGGKPKSNMGFPDSAYFFSFAAFAWLAKSEAPTAKARAFWKLLWPVLAYAAAIYRQRYTPNTSGGQYEEYTFEKFNAALSPNAIDGLRKPSMTRKQFRSILNDACSGC